MATPPSRHVTTNHVSGTRLAVLRDRAKGTPTSSPLHSTPSPSLPHSHPTHALSTAHANDPSKTKIDYEKFKTIAGLASANSARELMRVTKKKLKEEYGMLSNGVQDANSGNVRAISPNTIAFTHPHTLSSKLHHPLTFTPPRLHTRLTHSQMTPKTPSTASPRKRAAPGTGTGRKSTAMKNKRNATATAAINAGASEDDGFDVDEESPAKKEKKKRKVVRADSAVPAAVKAEFEFEFEGEEDGDMFT